MCAVKDDIAGDNGIQRPNVNERIVGAVAQNFARNDEVVTFEV